MKKILATAAAAGLLILTGCGGMGDDKLGDQAAQNADKKADALEDQADKLEDQADAVRDMGKAKEEAIDDSDVNAAALTNEQKVAVTNGM